MPSGFLSFFFDSTGGLLFTGWPQGGKVAKTSEGLQPKHWQALELWEEGIMSIKEIAGACKIPVHAMYHMFEGNAQKVGQTAHLFKSELDKITARTASRVRTLVKDNKKLALLQMNDRLKELHKVEKPGPEQTKEIVSIMNTLNKATPGVEIGSYHSLNFTKGMTAEELVYEFRRLTALAKHPSVGDGVRQSSPKGEGGVSSTPSE